MKNIFWNYYSPIFRVITHTSPKEYYNFNYSFKTSIFKSGANPVKYNFHIGIDLFLFLNIYPDINILTKNIALIIKQKLFNHFRFTRKLKPHKSIADPEREIIFYNSLAQIENHLIEQITEEYWNKKDNLILSYFEYNCTF